MVEGRLARVRLGDPEFGPVCACGGRKAKQAPDVPAVHSRIRGYGSVPRAEQERRWKRSSYGQAPPPVGDEDEALIARAAALAFARRIADGELAELIAEQALDDRLSGFSRTRWEVSLDALDVFGRPIYETLVVGA